VPLVITSKLSLHAIPQFAWDDRLVLARVVLTAVRDLSEVDAVIQNLRERFGGIPGASRSVPRGTGSFLSTRYDLGSELDEVGRLIGDRKISHGDRDVSLYEVMQDGMGVLLERLNPREAFRTRCGYDAGDTLRRRRHRALDADPSRCLHCLGR
jgi:hypothetical protein